jgi:hypothetical protein
MKMKTIIHVNRNVIAANAKHGRNDPAIIIRQGKKTQNAFHVRVTGAVEFLQNGEQLSCGARVWMETTGKVEILDVVDNPDIATTEAPCAV